MKILLATGASYEPPLGGSTRSNRAWLEVLAQRGHECVVVCPAAAESGTVRVGGVEVRRVADPAALRTVAAETIRSGAFDRVLVSTEDVAQQLLIAAEQEAPGRVVYLAHTPQLFPFGPASLNPNEAGTRAVGAAEQVIAIGRYTADIVEKHTGRRATIVHPPIYARAERVRGGDAVGLINPSAVKGLSIFVKLALRFPNLRFLALKGWGTTAADLDLLATVPNVQIAGTVADIGEFLGRVRVLLVPSLWPEGFGLVVIEAMLRGIPVLASDLGGLTEAKLGLPYLLPVRPVERYETRFDELHMPVAIVPEQDVTPWAAALEALFRDSAVYDDIAERSHRAAQRLVDEIEPLDIERALAGRMRILLVQNSQYFPAFGGGNKSNRLLMEALAANGHRCRVVTRIDAPEKRRQFAEELRKREIELHVEDDTARFLLGGVEVRAELDVSRVRERWRDEIRRFRPDWVLVSSDDPAMLFLETALDESGGRVVYLARTTLALPFGPDSAFASGAKTEALRRVAGVVAVSEYVADYVRTRAGIPAVHVPISLQGRGPFPSYGRFDAGFIVMVNPCAIKGLPIFLELARRCPEYGFAAVPTWGTTEADLDSLRALPNVTVLPPADNIDDILAKTRALLVPSLWAEARSRIVVESLLRGVPVLASNTGGIPEAMMGLDYVLPVTPIAHYRPELDQQMVPVADVPPQDVAPWERALRELLGDRERYERLSVESRRRALEYVENAGIGAFEAYLRGLKPQAAGGRTAAPVPETRTVIDTLSPEKRALLAARLRQRRLQQAPAAPAVSHRAQRSALSYAQERIVRVHETDPEHNVFNVAVIRKLRSAVEPATVDAAVNRVIARHEALRTSFQAGGQQVHDSVAFRLEEAPASIDAPFDLSRPPLLRASLADEILTVVVHHAVADGWSAAILARDLAGVEMPVRMQYRDWALWQRAQVDSEAWRAQRDYWTNELRGIEAATGGPPYNARRLWAEVPRVANPAGETEFMVLIGAWARILREWLGADEVAIASPVANRRMAECENTVGMLANTVVLRLRAHDDVRAKVLAAFANQDYPFELLDAPMPRFLFAHQTQAPATVRVCGVDTDAVEVEGGKTEHDLRLTVTGSRAMVQYRTNAVTETKAQELLDRFVSTIGDRQR